MRDAIRHISCNRLWLILLGAITMNTVQGTAQSQVLAPTVSTTIVVNGPLRYSTIHIPAGVTVRFRAPGFGFGSVPGIPAVVRCDGDAVIHGELSLMANLGNEYPAGWVTLGEGLPGSTCSTGSFFPFPQPGRHAGTYGTVIPFSLEGGSRGGSLDVYDVGCWPFLRQRIGGMGGGTLALLAGGRIDVHGTVTADGIHHGHSWALNGSSGGGSGGSILLRGHDGVTVHSGGSVTARGGTALNALAWSIGAPGYVRIDAYASTPLLQGTIDPVPTVLELPHLRTQSQPRIGTTWILDALAPENAPIFVSAALQPAAGPLTPFGQLGIDLPLAFGIALLVAAPDHDPIAGLPLAIPAAPGLIGQQLWFQALVVPPNLPPRLTNTLAVTVR
jgi:hypothetical protein